MNKSNDEWELDWWWMDALEGELDRDEKREAEWLLQKSPEALKRFESWRSLRQKIQKADPASNLSWAPDYFDRLREGIMAKIEEQNPIKTSTI